MEFPEIKFIVSVEFAYNRIPNKDTEAMYYASRYYYSTGDSLDDARKKRNEVVRMLEDCGYKIITKIEDGHNSYTQCVLCRAKGVECKILIKDISVSPLSYIERKAKTCLTDGEEYYKWNLENVQKI